MDGTEKTCFIYYVFVYDSEGALTSVLSPTVSKSIQLPAEARLSNLECSDLSLISAAAETADIILLHRRVPQYPISSDTVETQRYWEEKEVVNDPGSDGWSSDTKTEVTENGESVPPSGGSGVEIKHDPSGKVKIQVSFREVPEPVTNPFTDVYESDYYYDAVLWAVANGTGGNQFSPEMVASRPQTVPSCGENWPKPASAGGQNKQREGPASSGPSLIIGESYRRRFEYQQKQKCIQIPYWSSSRCTAPDAKRSAE